MSGKRVGNADKFTVRPFFIVGVLADIADQEIEQAVVVVVEEEGPRGVSNHAQSSLVGNVFEVAVPIVFQQHVSATNGGDKEILIAVVVDIGEGRGYANSSR